MTRLVRLFSTFLLFSATSLRADAGWTDLLSGDRMDAWRSVQGEHFPARDWTLTDGVLTIHRPSAGESRAGGDIITRARYASFEFEMEFRMTPGCNGGIKFLVQTGPTPLGPTVGPEFQILDDARHPDARGGRDGNRTLGSLYDLLPAATDKRVKPMGEWNHARIVVRGSHVEFWLNGGKTLEFDRHSDDYRALVAQSKYHIIPDFGEWADGHILIQDHGDEVSFRQIRIRELPAAPAPRVFRYTNPITRDAALGMRDHFIIKVGDKWYATGTSNPVWTGPNPGVRLLVSSDLLNWEHHSWLIDASALPPDCPYNGRFWAPEIHFIQGKYWLTVNSGRVTAEDPKGMKTHSVWLFVADTVTGPYQQASAGPLTPQYNNDATLFEDDDGQVYFYCSGGGLFQAKIDLAAGRLTTPAEKFLDRRQPGWPEWMIGGIEGPFVLKRDGTYFMFFSSWTRGYEVGLLKSKTPLGPWELVDREPIFGTRKKGYRPELAQSGGYAHLKFTDTQDPYQETGHNALFEGPDGRLWSSCHFFMDEKRPHPYAQPLLDWEKEPQLGITPVRYENDRFYIDGPTWTEQTVEW